MKLVSKTGETTTIELGMIDMHILVKALSHYSDDAYNLTNNVPHSDAATELYYQMVDVYCED